MGWKAIKDHYDIKHHVQVTDKGICIGSPYIHDIIVIGLDGVVRKRFDERGNDDLRRYQQAFDADPQKLRELALAQDTFAESIPVYTYEGGNILNKQCEALGWPNVTHDGLMQYDNAFSSDRSRVVAWAKRNADLGIESYTERIAEAEERLVALRARLAQEVADREKLEADFPAIEAV